MKKQVYFPVELTKQVKFHSNELAKAQRSLLHGAGQVLSVQVFARSLFTRYQYSLKMVKSNVTVAKTIHTTPTQFDNDEIFNSNIFVPVSLISKMSKRRYYTIRMEQLSFESFKASKQCSIFTVFQFSHDAVSKFTGQSSVFKTCRQKSGILV